MSDLLKILIGFVIGSGITAGFFGVMYRKLKSINESYWSHLLAAQKELDDLKNQMLQDQSKGYQDKQVLLEDKTRLESEIQQSQERISVLDKHLEDQLVQWEKKYHSQTQQMDELQKKLQVSQQQKNLLEDKLAKESARWERAIRGLNEENKALQKQLDSVREDLNQTTSKWQLQKDDWEQERLGLQMQVTESQMHVQPPTTPQASRDGSSAQLTVLNERISTLEKNNQSLQTQLSQARKEKSALESHLIQVDNKTSQERQALEEEIELLLDRLSRIQDQQINIASSA